MKQIKINNFYSSEFSNEFNFITSVEIEDEPFAEGGFGKVYHCNTINGKKLLQPQVLKIFSADNTSQKRLITIQKLQEKIKYKNIELIIQGKPTVPDTPALLGLPQFSFSGELNNDNVLGYSANRLDILGFIPFDTVLHDLTLTKQYYALPYDKKLSFCFHFAYGFEVLRSINYIHADINPQNFFINFSNGELAIIDFDSGAITDNPNDKPVTFGKEFEAEWLAPEITEQLINQNSSTPTIRVNLFTDTWSVAIGLHYLITLRHPFFFLRDLGNETIQDYLTKNKWNEIKEDDPNINLDANFIYSQYEKYKKLLKQSGLKEILNKLENTFVNGYFNPELRTTYDQWVIILGNSKKNSIFDRFINNKSLKKLVSKVRNILGVKYSKINGIIFDPEVKQIIGHSPIIRYFQTSNNFYDGINPVILSWKADNFNKILLNNEDVSARNMIEVSPKNDTTFILKVLNDYDIDGVESAPLLIKVDLTPPFIQFFQAEPSKPIGGEPVLLTWNIAGATQIMIDGIGMVTGNSFLCNPKEDTIFSLRAISSTGITSIARTAINVDKNPPIFNSLIIFPNFLDKAQTVHVQWEIENAEKLTILGFGDFPPIGEIFLTIRRDTTLTFIASSYYGIKSSKQEEITVSKEPPIIHFFETNLNILINATPAILTWSVENAEKVEINQGVGDVTGITSLEVHSMSDQVYTLTAWSYFGIRTSQTIEIFIDRTSPEIEYFTSDKAFIVADKRITLSWNAANAYSVQIFPSNTSVNQIDILETIIDQDTTFHLVANNFFGFKRQAEITIRILPIPIIESLLIPSLVIEEKLFIEYSRLNIAKLPEMSIHFNSNNSVELLKMTELKIDSFFPPISLKRDSLMEQVLEVYQKHFEKGFSKIRDLISEVFDRKSNKEY